MITGCLETCAGLNCPPPVKPTCCTSQAFTTYTHVCQCTFVWVAALVHTKFSRSGDPHHHPSWMRAAPPAHAARKPNGPHASKAQGTPLASSTALHFHSTHTGTHTSLQMHADLPHRAPSGAWPKNLFSSWRNGEFMILLLGDSHLADSSFTLHQWEARASQARHSVGFEIRTSPKLTDLGLRELCARKAARW
jgi:hypothetical protein